MKNSFTISTEKNCSLQKKSIRPLVNVNFIWLQTKLILTWHQKCHDRLRVFKAQFANIPVESLGVNLFIISNFCVCMFYVRALVRACVRPCVCELVRARVRE
jgi:hypothetical protein